MDFNDVSSAMIAESLEQDVVEETDLDSVQVAVGNINGPHVLAVGTSQEDVENLPVTSQSGVGNFTGEQNFPSLDISTYSEYSLSHLQQQPLLYQYQQSLQLLPKLILY